MKKFPWGFKVLIFYFIFSFFDELIQFLGFLKDFIDNDRKVSDYGTFAGGMGGFLGTWFGYLFSLMIASLSLYFIYKKSSKGLKVIKITFFILGLRFTSEFARGFAGGYHLITYMFCYLIFGVIVYKVFKYLNTGKIKNVFNKS